MFLNPLLSAFMRTRRQFSVLGSNERTRPVGPTMEANSIEKKPTLAPISIAVMPGFTCSRMKLTICGSYVLCLIMDLLTA